MFTVARLLPSSAGSRRLIDEHVATIDSLSPGSPFEARRRGDGFAASVSASPDWPTHASDIENFLLPVLDGLRALSLAGVAVTLDVAIGPEDTTEPINSIHFSPRLIELIQRCGASLEVSVYAGE
jgi:hypothetical protein